MVSISCLRVWTKSWSFMKAKSERWSVLISCSFPGAVLGFFILFCSDLHLFYFSGPMSWATLGRNQSISHSMPVNTSTSWHILWRTLCQAAYQVRILQLLLFSVNFTAFPRWPVVCDKKANLRLSSSALLGLWNPLCELLWISFFSGRKNIFLYSWGSFSCRKWFWEFISLAGEWPWL